MSEPNVEQTAGPGERLNDESWKKLFDALGTIADVPQYGAYRATIVDTLAPIVAALVAAARREAEERGAAKERKRIKPPDVLELYNERGQLTDKVMIAASNSYETTLDQAPRVRRVRLLRGQEPAS